MQNGFPSRFGCNLPYLAYLDAVHKPLPEESFSPQIHPIKWVYFLEDLQSLRALAQKGYFHIMSLFSDYSLRNEFALFAWDDPVPFFILGCQSLSTVFSNLFRSNH
jgi:hypothetical protein